MDRKIRKMYYEMQGKVIFPEGHEGSDNSALAATVAANMASIGFPMTTEQTKKLAQADRDDIISFYKENYAMLSEVVGAGKTPQPFYPDFPEGCMGKDDVDYFIDQIVYGLSGLTLEPKDFQEEKERFPFIGTPMRHILMEGSEEDLAKTFEMAVNSSIAFSKEQREFMKAYASEHPECVDTMAHTAATCKNRENAVALAMMAEEISGNAFKTLDALKQPADVLRYAAFKSVVNENRKNNGTRDPYEAIALRDTPDKMPKFQLGRKERATAMDALASMGKGGPERLSNNMHGHDEEWNRLFAHIHVTDKAWDKPMYANVKDAILIIQKGTKLDRYARRIEEAIKAKDVEAAVKEASKMPGDFMRRFDKLYRMSIEQGKEGQVLEALREAAPKAGIATVTGVIGNLEKRSTEETERYFKDPKTGKVIKDTTKLRKPFTQSQVNIAKADAMEGLATRFAGKEGMGKVYISESLKDVKIPADIRDSSGNLGAITSGSKTPIDGGWDNIRFFVSWTNLEHNSETQKRNEGHGYYYGDGRRVDIDLTAAMLDKDMKLVGFCGWNGEKSRDGYVYSGDVQDGGEPGGEGRAEFIDIDLKKVKAKGVAYIIPQVNSYTEQDFSEQPHTCFGVMKREQEDFGETFEPSTVVNRYVLDVEATEFAPYAIDVENRQLLWLNEKTMQNVASRGLDNTISQLGRANTSKTMPLYPLVEANAIANGLKALSPKDADMVFVRDADEMQDIMDSYGITEEGRFILSTNTEYITGVLMQDGPGNDEPNERVRERMPEMESEEKADRADEGKDDGWGDDFWDGQGIFEDCDR